MGPDDLPLLRTPGVPALSPDGRLAVFDVGAPDLEADATTGQLWLVPTDGSAAPRRLTRGHHDTAPAWSPDGRLLAFLREEPGGKPQLQVMPAGGGEPVALTAAVLGVGAPTWAPDGSRIAWCARVPEPGRYGTDEAVTAAAEPPRLVTRLAYRLDDVGFLPDKPSQVFVCAAPDLDAAPGTALPVPVQITHGDRDSTEVSWSPDGQRLAFSRPAEADGDLRTDVFSCTDDGSDERRITDGSLAVGWPAWSPDGATIWFLAQDFGPTGLDFVAATTGLWSVPADGSAAPTLHTDPETDDLQAARGSLSVGPDGVVVQRLHRGAVQLIRIGADGTRTPLVDGPRVVRAHAAGPGGLVVATVADDGSAGDLVVAGGPRLTDLTAPLRERGLLPAQERTYRGPDGYDVHGWVVLPPGEGPHPVLLLIHGGPYAQYDHGLFDEQQVYAAAGYAVVSCNPRGSAGYGRAHGRVIREAMGGVDADDVLTFLDGALAETGLHLDAARVGVMGGSYGGYLTAWLTTRTQRFVAAIVERGFLDPVSFVGSSDIGWFFSGQYLGTDPAAVAAQSPMAHLAAVRTPTLVIHSEHDWRCPVEQGQRWFVGLRLQGVETELLLFPGEGHELSRSGRPRHRQARFEHVLRWWGRQLSVS